MTTLRVLLLLLFSFALPAQMFSVPDAVGVDGGLLIDSVVEIDRQVDCPGCAYSATQDGSWLNMRRTKNQYNATSTMSDGIVDFSIVTFSNKGECQPNDELGCDEVTGCNSMVLLFPSFPFGGSTIVSVVDSGGNIVTVIFLFPGSGGLGFPSRLACSDSEMFWITTDSISATGVTGSTTVAIGTYCGSCQSAEWQ